MGWEVGKNDPGGSWGRSDRKGNKFEKKGGCGKEVAGILLILVLGAAEALNWIGRVLFE